MFTEQELEQIKEVVSYLSAYEKPFTIFPNPISREGFFVSQDKEILPYPGVKSFAGKSLYPPTPINAKSFPVQLSLKIAKEVVRILNAEELQK